MSRFWAAAAITSVAAWAGTPHLVEGAAESHVRVIVYEDLACPDCATFRTMLDERLLPRYATTVAFEHRDFPLPKHPWARKAAIAARFLDEARSGAGLAFRKFLLANLGDINTTNFEPIFREFAERQGVDPAKAATALSDQRLANLVEEDYQEGAARGVARTPTVFVNGHPFIESFTFEEISKAIDSELAGVLQGPH
ncbi:MAG TPA: thioredoxin domain-containing protein [Bryobacteraceae bacterium]|nr:thioredoxin domain-containing protein [Bryobacteraceae bacterium]